MKKLYILLILMKYINKIMLIFFILLFIILSIYLYNSRNNCNINKIINNYKGYNLKYENEKIDRIYLNKITSKILFEKYIINRKPLVFKSTIDGEYKNWDNNYLKKIIGNDEFIILKKKDKEIYFGHYRINMKFNNFINKLESGNNNYYMNVQEGKSDGSPFLISTALKKLFKLNHFPSKPKIFSNLIPEQINLWIGGMHSKSRLHHDYVDNLYIVIKGKKKFKLYAPNDSIYLYTYGCIKKIYENGNIEYDSKKNTSKNPNHFSKIDFTKKESEIKKMFKLYSRTKKIICEVNEGEMIYIPCGWFHEVESFGNKNTKSHISINYWFKTPDLLNKKSFEYPYKDKFLKEIFLEEIKNYK